MSVLVIGRGAEDVEHPLGIAVMRGYLHPAGLLGLDIDAARTSCTRGEAGAVLDWYLREEAPVHVLLVGDHGASDAEVETLGAALGDRLVHVADQAEAVGRLDALTAAAPRPVVRERRPRVTLGMPVFNQERYLHAALRGALDQTYDDYEVLVLDDGSTDSSRQILAEYAGHPRLRVVEQSNLGQTGRMDLVLNRLIRHSRGELLAAVGGDDVCRPDRLSAQVSAFDEDPDLDICHGAMACIDADDRALGQDLVLPHAYDEASMLRSTVTQNPVAGPTVMMRRRAHETVALYADGIAGDHELWTKASGRLRFRYLPQTLVDYRLHDKALSTTPEGVQHCAREAHRGLTNIITKRSLADFYPELEVSGTPQTWYAAGLGLGARFTLRDPRLSLYFYELALAHHDGAEVHHNTALAHLALDQVGLAERAASRAAALDTRSLGLRTFLRGGPAAPLRLATRDAEVAEAVRLGRDERSFVSWDGTGSQVSSLYAAVDVTQHDVVEAVITAWAGSTRAEDPVRLVVPTLGHSAQTVLDHLLAVSGTALQGAAEVVIETVDAMRLLPQDLAPHPIPHPSHAGRVVDWVEATRGRLRSGGGLLTVG